jgi:isopentenyl-diphosphate delta-isomerase
MRATGLNKPASEHVILVDRYDRAIGTEEKTRAHRTPLLHRAFSVFLFDRAGRVLLQRRARDKYHSGGLWSNTCCGHPRPGENVAAAAARRLQEEMGIEARLRRAGAFLYQARLGPNTYEHEFDHVFTGDWEGSPRPDPAEVLEWRWVRLSDVTQLLAAHGHMFTVWFAPALATAQRARRGLAASASGRDR